jgi:hypothetical protein
MRKRSKLVSDASGLRLPVRTRYVALAFAPDRYPHQSRWRNLAVKRTLQILDWLQDSALQRCKNEAFILFMIDAAKRFTEDLLKHCHDAETPFFKE